MPFDRHAESDMAELAYRVLGEAFAMAVALMDSNMVITWCNPAAAAVLGWPSDQIVGKNAADFIHPEDIGNFLPIADEMSTFAEDNDGPLSPSAPVELPCRLLRADGSYSAMSVTGRVLDAEGNMLAVVRPSSESHAFAAVLDGLGTAAPLDQMLSALVDLLKAQFDVDQAWIAHDSRGNVEVLGCDDEAVPFDPSGVLASLRAFDSDEWFVLVQGNVWVAPVQSGDADRILGAFILPATRTEGPSPWDELIAHRTANLTAAVFARDLRDRMLTVAATTDHLTGVLNRREFERHLKGGSDAALPTTLFFLDLDDFKVVNDDFGHLAGDAVLATVARRLQRVVRTHDRVGRLGGDEFVVSCPGLTEVDTEPTRERISSVVEEPVVIEGRKVTVTVSIGVARAFTVEQLDTLITRSDADMFHRKRNAKERSSGVRPVDDPGWKSRR